MINNNYLKDSVDKQLSVLKKAIDKRNDPLKYEQLELPLEELPGG